MVRSNDRRRIAPQSTPPATMAPHGAGANAVPAVAVLQQWVTHWRDLMEFEFVPVVPSKDTRAIFEGAK